MLLQRAFTDPAALSEGLVLEGGWWAAPWGEGRPPALCPRREDAMRGMRHAGAAVLLAVVALAAWGPGALGGEGDELVLLARARGRPVIADFGLGFCRQCRKQAEALDEILRTCAGKVVIRFVNVGKEADLARRYGVEWIPTLVFLDAGGRVVLKKVGPLAPEEIRAQLFRMGVE